MKSPILLYFILMLSSKVLAQPGTLDSTFGIGGKVITDVDHFRNVTNAAVIQSDGKIVVIGYSSEFSDTGYFTLIRYNVDGSIDINFGENGIVKTIIGPNEDLAFAAAIQPDGKIIAAGYTWNGVSYDFAMARYLTNGSRDLTFGSGGIVTSDFNGNSEKANAIMLRSNGKIVLAGYSDDAANYDINFAIAQYNTDGSIDTGFGTNGVTILSVGEMGTWQSIRAIAEQSDGQIVAAGFSEIFDITIGKLVNQMALVRFDNNGVPDLTFGKNGMVATRIGEDNIATSISIQGDDKILALGRTREKKYDYPNFVLARYDINGTLDLTFGDQGIVVSSFDNTDDEGYSLILQPDQKILAAGFSARNNGTTVDFSLARYLSDGSLDNTFGTGGKVLTDIVGSSDFGSFVLLQKNGKIVVGGYSKIGTDYDISIVRYLNDMALPVILDNFDVIKVDHGVLLNWRTSYAANFDHFDIQKSFDTKKWTTIDIQTMSPTPDSISTFNFLDYGLCEGRLYYRLKMVDSDSTFAYSSVKTILVDDSKNSIVIYPNPASDQIFIMSDIDLPEKITLVNGAGKKLSLTRSSNNMLDISSLEDGLYTIVIDSNTRKAFSKVVISR